MKVLRILGKIFLVLLIIILALGLIIFGLRTYNENKYKPEDYNPEAELPPTDLSQYDTNLEGIEVTRVEGDYMNGFHLKPEEKRHPGVVITFGGSEGSPNYWAAEPFAQGGYEVLSLFFFGMENQQKELVEVPLDFFSEVLTYIDENIEDGEIITVYGVSKGAELGLNLAVRYPEIDNVILGAPAEFSYMGLSYENYGDLKSSWTWKGEPVPFIDMSKGDGREAFNLFKAMLLNESIAYRPGYESAANNDPNREEARIKVEDTEANILLIAGSEDKMWQADVAAQHIYEMRPENTELHIFEGAGHIFRDDGRAYSNGISLEMGGTKEANEKAGQESNQIYKETLEKWHGSYE